MISLQIQIMLLAIYILLATLEFVGKNYAKGLYWLGASILTTGVLMMK